MLASKHYRQIDPNTALLFDFLRGLSATIVVMGHAVYYYLYDFKELVRLALNTGHLAVVTFFVISGFMICSSLLRRLHTDPNGKLNVQQFALDRLIRLAPPLIAAMLLMIPSYLLLSTLNHPGYSHFWSIKQAIATVFFQLTMGLDIPAPHLNNPLWSLSHEFWFYVGGVLITLSLVATQKTGKIAPFILLISIIYGLTTLKWGMGFVVWLNGGLLAVFYQRYRVTGNRDIKLEIQKHTINSDNQARSISAWKTTIQTRSGLLVILLSTLVCLSALYFVTGPEVGYGRYVFGVLLATTVGCWITHQALTKHRSVTQLAELAKILNICLSAGRSMIKVAASIAPYSYTLYVIHYPLLLVSFELSRQWRHSTSSAIIFIGVYLLCIFPLSKALAKFVENPKRLHHFYEGLKVRSGN